MTVTSSSATRRMRGNSVVMPSPSPTWMRPRHQCHLRSRAGGEPLGDEHRVELSHAVGDRDPAADIGGETAHRVEDGVAAIGRY
jgi:hypothetical protein